jgi:hypothetical protein
MSAAAQAASSPSAQRLATTAVVIPARTARAAAISPAGPASMKITSKTFSPVTALPTLGTADDF